MKKIFSILILIVGMIFIGGCDNLNNSQNKNLVTKLQVIEYDSVTKEEKVYQEYDVKVGETIVLHDKNFNNCGNESNDVEIVSIEKEYVEISRNKIRYENSDISKKYIEKVTDKINYNVKFDTTINESIPNGPLCSQARTSYDLVFVKK